jgi:hypothetical protein
MFAALLLLLLSAEPNDAKPIGRLEHPPIREASGIVKSRRFPNIFWVHNDSGNPPALFAVHADGTLVREYKVSAANVDWEDIAIDNDGHLYLGDIGNNNGRLPVRAIYRVDEPDPSREPDGPLQVTLASFYRFPKDGRFDAESLVIDGKRALIVAKTFSKDDAVIYAVPLDPPASLLRPALPERVGALAGFTEPATGASLSEDGQWLAVCGYEVARVYHRDGERWALAAEVHFRADEIEAICWDGRDLVLAGEARGLYRINESSWRKPRGKAAQRGS